MVPYFIEFHIRLPTFLWQLRCFVERIIRKRLSDSFNHNSAIVRLSANSSCVSHHGQRPPHITSVQYCGGCSVHWRLFSTSGGPITSVQWGDSFSTVGDSFSTVEVVQYSGGQHQYMWGDNISTVGDNISTVGDNISTVGITSVLWGITSVLWRDTFSTVGITAVHVGNIFSTVGDTFSTVEVVQYSGG